METKIVTVKSLRKDRTGIQDTEGNWYANKFKTFDNVQSGQKVELSFNDKGYLNDIKVLSGSITIGQEIKNENFEKQSKRKEASMCVSYAKDLACEGKIEVEDIADKARGFMSLIEELATGKIEKPEPEYESSVNNDGELE